MQSQKINSQKLFHYFFIVVSVFVFIIVGIRCATVPFCHDEITTFYYYLQAGNFLPYLAHKDANNHVLNSWLSWLCFKAFGISPFSLRLPNLLALIILVLAVYKISKQLKHTHSKLVLVAGFLLSFHWLGFYSVCRGYGLSMSFLILSIAYLIEYFHLKELKKLFLFYLFIQVAICANLTLVIISILLTFAVICFQLLNKELLKRTNIIMLLIHGAIILFWVKHSFSLQAGGQLYAGEGESYWQVTFISLIELIIGKTNKWILLCIPASFLILWIVTVAINFKKTRTTIQNIFTPSLFYPIILTGLIVIFYAMKKILHINYPEDRTGLFFYVFFVLSIVFVLEHFTGNPVKILTCFIMIGTCIHFIMNINFRKYPLHLYATIPERFYTRLLEEQKLTPEKITIGGQRMTEFIYDFWNYRYNGALNIVDAPCADKIEMDYDYAVAWNYQKRYYKPYYDEIDVDKDWGITLLKRKEKIKRTLLITIDSLTLLKGNKDYYNLYEIKDTDFKNTNPLLVEITIGWIQAEMPLNAWLVLAIDSADGRSVCYKRIALNWIRYDWNNSKNQKLYLVSGQLPPKLHRLNCYLWNLDKKELTCKINSITIYQLEGNSINVTMPTDDLASP